jgi:hypothetical protein
VVVQEKKGEKWQGHDGQRIKESRREIIRKGSRHVIEDKGAVAAEGS